MPEKNIPVESPPLNQVAKEIGSSLARIQNIEELREVETSHGPLTRIGKIRTGLKIPLDYQHKKNLFEGEAQGQPVIILYFSGEVYGQDPDYFRRIYQDAKGVYSGQAVQFTRRKITPSLFGYDDQTMTLIIEKGVHDLGFYFFSTNEEEVREVIGESIDLMRYVWKESKTANNQLPRYVTAFLEPEYFFLAGKRPEDYLKDPEITNFYKQTQVELGEYLDRLNQARFERGFGFGDIKPPNLVKDKDGYILFIDVEKPGFSYHWLSMLGQFYQGTIKEASNSLFRQVSEQEFIRLLNFDSQPELAAKLFALGRINRLLIGCTLRNIVFTTEIGLPINKQEIKINLTQVRRLMKVTSAKEVT